MRHPSVELTWFSMRECRSRTRIWHSQSVSVTKHANREPCGHHPPPHTSSRSPRVEPEQPREPAEAPPLRQAQGPGVGGLSTSSRTGVGRRSTRSGTGEAWPFDTLRVRRGLALRHAQGPRCSPHAPRPDDVSVRHSRGCGPRNAAQMCHRAAVVPARPARIAAAQLARIAAQPARIADSAATAAADPANVKFRSGRPPSAPRTTAPASCATSQPAARSQGLRQRS